MDELNNFIGLLLSSTTGQDARPIIITISTKLYNGSIIDDLASKITYLKEDMNTVASNISNLIDVIEEYFNAGSEEAEEA